MENQKKSKKVSDIGRRLREVRFRLGHRNQAAFGEALGGFTLDQVSRAERGDSHPPPEMLEALALRGISVNWLLLGRGDMLALISTEANMEDPPSAERVIDEEGGPGRSKAGGPYVVHRIVAAGFREVAEEELPGGIPTPGLHIPIISRIRAGAAMDTSEAEQHPPGSAESYVEYRGASDRAFALRIVGDSMAPEYLNGDLLIIDPNRPVREGACCVVYFDEERDRVARFKMLSRVATGVVLKSLNPAYPPIEIPANRFLAAWKIVDHLPHTIERRVRP